MPTDEADIHEILPGTDSGIERVSEDASKKEAEGAVDETKVELERLRADNARLSTESAKAASDAAAARAYSEQIVASLRVAAETSRAGNGQEGAVDPRERFNEDPVGAVNDMFRERVGPIYNQYLANQADLNRQLAAERCKDKGWSVYEKEVDEFMTNMAPDVKAQPGSYEKALDFVKARNIDKEVERQVQARLAQEKGGFVEAPSAAGGAKPKVTALSDAEKQVAKGLGISEDDYARFRA